MDTNVERVIWKDGHGQVNSGIVWTQYLTFCFVYYYIGLTLQ